MKTPKATVKRLPLQTCLLINPSIEDPKLLDLFSYILGKEMPTIVPITSFDAVLNKCPHQDVILITNDFNGLQEKLHSPSLQPLLEKHRFHVLVFQHQNNPSAFPKTSHIKYINRLDETLLAYQLKREMLRELRFIRKKILKALVENSRKQRIQSLNLKSANFKSTLTFLVHSHYTNPRFTTADLAKMMQVSIRTLERKTVTLTGQTPRQFLLEYRLQKAKNDLLTSYNKVGQVAKAHGFASASYFSVSFFERFGINPSQARQNEAALSVG